MLHLVLETAHLNLGYHIANPGISIPHKIIHNLLPWPLYTIDDFASDKLSPQNQDETSTSSIYLSDGGHSDNLGMLPLIRRGVKEIYLVDAESDAGSTFESARRLKKTLDNYDINFCFLHKDALDVYSASQPFFKAYIKKRESIDDACKDEEKDIPEYKKNKDDPYTRINYIKLSMPSPADENGRPSNLPQSVQRYARTHPDFPHESTADIFYSPEQYRAYRDLGFYIVDRALGEVKSKAEAIDRAQPPL